MEDALLGRQPGKINETKVLNKHASIFDGRVGSGDSVRSGFAIRAIFISFNQKSLAVNPLGNIVNVQIVLQSLMPKRSLSAVVGALARMRRPEWLKNQAIRWYIQHYGVDMSQAARTLPANYVNFEDFFTRELKPQARSMTDVAYAIACPVDGSVSSAGPIEDGMLIQAKGYRYSVSELIGRDSTVYEGGTFLSVYLAPKDYHRVHVPVEAVLEESVGFSGSLFSVNAATEAGIPGLFCRNERVVFHFRLSTGPVCLVMVGALIVASIRSPFAPSSAGHAEADPRETRKSYGENLTRGMELGRFAMGSTIVLLVAPQVGQLKQLPRGSLVRVGEAIGELRLC